MSKSFSESYKAAGVDITAGYRAVELMKRHVARTVIPGADTDIGGFGGLFVPDIAGMDIANPIGTIMSAAMMLRYSFDMAAEADAIEAAVNKTLDDGYRTADIWKEGFKRVGCAEMGAAVADRL